MVTLRRARRILRLLAATFIEVVASSHQTSISLDNRPTATYGSVIGGGTVPHDHDAEAVASVS